MIYILPDSVLQPDPWGHGSCSFALGLLDSSFKEEHCPQIVDMQVESVLPLSFPQTYLDCYLHGHWDEDTSPRMSVTSPLPLVGVRLLLSHQEWSSITEDQFILKVVWIRTCMVFRNWHLLSDTCIPFSLPHEGI